MVCGVAGWADFSRTHAGRSWPEVAAMTATLAPRGPDAEGVWCRDHVALGHRRLAVVDVEASAQPMSVTVAGGEVALTYSGEVYNYRALREELSVLGHRFTTRGDTEVVLRGYLEWGERLVDRLAGMYAFAIWDGRTERLLLVRDRLGIKPLYYHRLGAGLLFASETKALLAHPRVEAVVDTDGLRELLTFSRTPGHAVYQGIEELRPGTMLWMDRSGLSERTYWRLPVYEHTDDASATTATVRALLAQAVGEQLDADVPLAMLLSGGLDSSAVTALAARRQAPGDARLLSFTTDCQEQDTFRPTATRHSTDAPYARLVADHLGTRHHEILHPPALLADPHLRKQLVHAQDLPRGMGDIDGGLLLLLQQLRPQATVVLTGEGADELFGGYHWFHQPELIDAPTFPWAAGNRGRWAHTAPLYTPEVRHLLQGDVYLADSHSAACAEVPRPGSGQGGTHTDTEHRMRTVTYLHLTRFLPMMLERKDRISMAVGVEARVPLCDHRLVEYVYNAPWHMKATAGRDKVLLRDAITDLLPTAVVQRAKSHFPSTQSTAYTTALQAQARTLLADPNHEVFTLFDHAAVGRVAAAPPGPHPHTALQRFLDTATWLTTVQPLIKTT
ncbi:asparagine synthase (glutamine-hydrolyzing) [Streptomyces violascens]|uniref:asparagine synthase (glutamine-hydrolyzing) n=1 Tax=Streptomyces violascens TaxID=67381 RepID=UPI0036651820